MTKKLDATLCWTGLAEVRANPGNKLLPNDKNAFARLFGMAKDADDFVSRANGMLRHCELEVIGFSGVQPIVDSKLYGETKERLEELIGQARMVAGPLLGTFHRYPSDSKGGA